MKESFAQRRNWLDYEDTTMLLKSITDPEYLSLDVKVRSNSLKPLRNTVIRSGHFYGVLEFLTV